MRFKLFVLANLTIGLFAAAFPAFSQVVPAYKARTLPLSVGIGPSSYDVDWGNGRMFGGTFWIDYYPGRLPRVLHGLGVEVEARDISLGRHLPSQQNVRQDTAEGGAIYTWRHFENFHPYAKFLYGHGSFDFTLPHSTMYAHDTRSLWAPGGGFEYRIYRQVWARADYEYQVWQDLFGFYNPHPQGFTAGVAYDFMHPVPR